MRRGIRLLAAAVAAIAVVLAGGAFLLTRADGPVLVFAGGPLHSGELVGFADVDWEALDRLNELEIVGEGRSGTLWFSVDDGVPYVGCDLDCAGGVLTRRPQQVERDDRVVIRVEGRLVEGRLVHVAHGSAEYASARAARERKYSGGSGGRAAAETAAHEAVVEVGEVLSGRSQRSKPGDRLYRVAPR